MRINIPNNKRHFVVAEEVRDRYVVTSAETATWRNVDVVDVQLLAIGHCDRRHTEAEVEASVPASAAPPPRAI